MAQIYPSLMAANIDDLANLITKLDPYCAGYHLDIMDEKFVPNSALDIKTVNMIARSTYKKIWVQLLVEDPQAWLEKLFLPADSIVSFHIESKGEIMRTIKLIQEKEWIPSIAVNPKTSVDEVFTYLNILGQVLIMSVPPGYSGQPFMKSTIKKVDQIVSYRQTANLNLKIGMDGGINKNNIVMLKENGIDDFSIGSGIFDSDDPIKTLKELNALIDEEK